MDLQRFKKLQSTFENRQFEAAYKWTEKTLYIGSIFGNILCIVFAFFFINDIVNNAAVHFQGQHIVLPIFVLLFLTLFELTKRFVFGNVVTNYLITKKINGTVITNFLFSLLLVVGSFYLSLSGANTYSNKSETITNNTDSILSVEKTKLDSIYNKDITKVEDRINYTYKSAEKRKKQALTEDELTNVKLWEEEVKSLKKNKEKEFTAFKTTLESKLNTKLEKTNKGSLAFLFISAFLELLILIGVVFSKYYYYTTFVETKDKLEGNLNYSKLKDSLTLLNILYNNGKTKKNQPLPTTTKFRELTKVTKDKKFKVAEVTEFLALMNYLNITRLEGKTKVSNVDYNTAIETVTNHYPLFD